VVYRSFLLVPLAVLLAGCGSSRPAVVPPAAGFPNHTAAEVIRHLPTADSLWTSFLADLTIAYSLPGDRGTLKAKVAYRRADSVLIRFRAPLGIEVSRALITRDSMLVYDRVRRKLYHGSRLATLSMLPAAFRASDIAVALFGYDGLGAGEWTIVPEEQQYRLTSADSSESVLVDPGRWRIVAVDERDAQGMIVEQRRFTDFERIDGRFIPRRIVTSRPAEDMRASVSIRRLRPDPEDLSFDLGLRSDIQRIPVY
jgi:uncharacterized protein DUF4292